MRIILKILLFPITLILGIASSFLRFIILVGGGIISVLSYLLAGFATIIFFIGFIPWQQLLTAYIICFIFSPFGLLAIANFLLDGIDTLTMKMKTI